MDFRYARHLTFALAAATAISDAVYLLYLRHHHLVRAWSGANSVLLGLFMLALSMFIMRPRSRWASIAIAGVGVANVLAGGLFFF